MSSSGRAFATALALAAFGLTAAAQRVAPVSDAVPVDFFVSGPDGPVFDLRIDEVSLEVDGKPRKIRWLRYIPLTDAPPPAQEAPGEVEPPFGTNVPGASGRWVTIVVDHESIRPGTARNAVNAAVRYIQTLGPGDRVSYVTAPNGGIEVDFTTNHDQVIAALRKFMGRAPREAGERERSCRSRLLLHSMRDYIEGLAPFDGPKIVVLLSSGVLNPRRDAPMLGPPGPCEIRMVYFQEVAAAASRARAHLFIVQPDDLRMDPAGQAFTDPTASRFAGADEDRAGLESLAGVTGGEFTRVVGPDDTTLVQLAGGLSGYYEATFDPTPRERNGALHRVEVTVAREGTRVRTNPEVLIPRLNTHAVSVAPKEMLRNAVVYRELPLRVAAFASAGDGGKVKILTVLEPAERGVTISEAVFGLIDQRDRLVAQWTANPAELAADPIITAGEAVPGPYRLRVAAVDSTGRRGKAEYAFLARLTPAPPLELSAIAVGISTEGSFQPKLVFGADQTAVAYFEIYGRAPQPGSVTVRVEIARAEDSEALVTAPARVVAQSASHRVAVGSLPIASLRAGDYVLRAIVSVDGRPVGRLARPIRTRPGA